MEQLDGTVRRILLDTGWNPAWMKERFRAEGVDRLLRDGQIDFLLMTHEHMDHYWGLSAVTENKPDIKMIIPDTFSPEAYTFMEKAGFRGELVKHVPGKPHVLMPGVAAVVFDVPIILLVQGEQVLYFNIQDKGLVTVTGCCHPGLITILEYARHTFANADRIYGVYGGLHISPFEDWDPQYDDLVYALKDYGIRILGCNHCTGYVTAEKMLAAGLPVVRGTARFKTRRDIYLGNGDTVTF